MSFSEIIVSLEESATLALAQRVRELKAEGRDVIGLTLGEPDFDTPAFICEAAKAALDAGMTHYPPVPGLASLREAISAKFKRDNGLNYSPDQIVVSTGAKQSLYNIVQVLLNPGDEVILPAPYWVSYMAMIHIARGKANILQTGVEDAYKITPDQLEAAITPNTKLLFLCTPSNPSGSMYTREELTALVAVLEKHPHVYIIADEIYEHITYGTEHVSLGTYEAVADRVITVNGFSKGFAMTGWRLGYIGAPKDVAKLCIKLQGQVTSGANAFAMQGAVAALEGNLDATYAMRDAFRERRDNLYQKLQAIPGVKTTLPDGAFYFYPDLGEFIGKTTPGGKKIENIGELCLYLIESHNVVLVPGSAFGTATHARISYAYSMESLNTAMERLATGLGQLQ